MTYFREYFLMVQGLKEQTDLLQVTNAGYLLLKLKGHKQSLSGPRWLVIKSNVRSA